MFVCVSRPFSYSDLNEIKYRSKVKVQSLFLACGGHFPCAHVTLASHQSTIPKLGKSIARIVSQVILNTQVAQQTTGREVISQVPELEGRNECHKVVKWS